MADRIAGAYFATTVAGFNEEKKYLADSFRVVGLALMVGPALDALRDTPTFHPVEVFIMVTFGLAITILGLGVASSKLSEGG